MMPEPKTIKAWFPVISSNRKLISAFYKISETRLEKHLSSNYKQHGSYEFYQGEALESHLYENYSQDELFNKIRNVLMEKDKAFKINVQLGYTLIDRVTGLERYYYPGTNTSIFDLPIPINSKSDIDDKGHGSWKT
ncbi:hypothetical protein F441_20453 [Phytophthora nicotianae CJ01A1]|uniref:Uncharacterized protein n=1 Tax=Phytophthora nicotianae CJ01A1 TaxID=1317063 RepID=W2VXM1_PHYNI|nr:hypothetical protein F441_20453 [Phytophthora nicotianae CJ01A1]